MLCSLTRGQPVIRVDTLALLAVARWNGIPVLRVQHSPRCRDGIVSATQYVKGRSNPEDIGFFAFHGTPSGACYHSLPSATE
jgi:hypothetical protein